MDAYADLRNTEQLPVSNPRKTQVTCHNLSFPVRMAAQKQGSARRLLFLRHSPGKLAECPAYTDSALMILF